METEKLDQFYKNLRLRTGLAANSLPAIVLALFASVPISALAEVQPPTPSIQNQTVTIPQSAAIIISFPTAVTFDTSQKQIITTAAYLAKPLLDSNGKVVAETNSPINIQLQPTKAGVRIKAEALVVNGQVTPIQTDGPLIPDRPVTPASSIQKAQANQSLYGNMAGSAFNVLLGAFGGANLFGSDQTSNIGNFMGNGLVGISGLSSPKPSRQVDIPQGSVYILTLKDPVTISPKVIQAPIATATKLPAPRLENPVVREPISTGVTVYVNSANGVDGADAGKKATPYRTITYALKQAAAYTIIQLAAGSYTEKTGEVFPLVIKSVTLRGDASTKGQNIIIAGGDRYISPTFARQNITLQAENSSTITGVTITNPNRRGTAIWIESTNPTIENNTFTNSNREGIFITGTAAPSIQSNVFTKNGGNGISLARSAHGEIRHNLFQDTGFGIAIGGTASPLVTENQFIQNQDGMFISEDARPVLRHNTIKNNKRDGVVIAACAQAQPDLGTTENSGGNIFSDNGQYDIHNSGAKSLLESGNQLDRSRVAEPKQQCSWAG